MEDSPSPLDRADLERCAALAEAQVSRLPHVVAAPLQDFIHATRGSSAYLTLHHLTDVADLLVRFCTVVVLAEVRRVEGGSFPELLRRDLARHFAFPSLTRWQILLASACAWLRKEHRLARCVVPGLPTFVVEHLQPWLGGPNQDPASSVVALRNQLAHCGRLARADEQRLLSAHLQGFTALLRGMEALLDLDIVAEDKGHLLLLRGLPDAEGRFQRVPEGTALPDVAIGPERVVLLRSERALDLYPLHRWADVHRIAERSRQVRGEELPAIADSALLRVDEASPSPQIYFRRSRPDILDYTTLSPNASFSQDAGRALQEFRDVFSIDETPRSTVDAEFDFSPWCGDLLANFVGRRGQLDAVEDTVRRAQHRLIWIHGHPGMGKSAFMAALAARLEGFAACSVVHFFRATDPRCNRTAFLRNASAVLETNLGPHRVRQLEDGDRQGSEPVRGHSSVPAQGTPSTSEGRLRRLIDAAVASAPPGSPAIAFLLDGIDEVSAQDPDFLDVVLDNRVDRVVWVVAGQPHVQLHERLVSAGAHLPFESAGLPPLTNAEVRAVIDAECGRAVYELYARDRAEAPEGGISNPFLDELVRRSAGLPLYLRLLVDDVREGRVTFREGAEKDLPWGLERYYERTLERLGVGDAPAVLASVFGLLALAREPLTRETVLLLLAEERLLRGKNGAAVLDRALGHGHVMLDRRAVATTPVSDGEDAPAPVPEVGFAIHHESFRNFLRRSPTQAAALEAGSADFCRLAFGWDAIASASAKRYHVRHGAWHLLDAGRIDEACQLLLDVDYAGALCRESGPAAVTAAYRAAADVAVDDRSRLLALLGRATEVEAGFLTAHPDLFFQTVLDRCRFHDSPDAERHYAAPADGWRRPPPWSEDGPKLHDLMLEWFKKRISDPQFVVAMSHRPPPERLDSPTHLILRGHRGDVNGVAAAPDGTRLASFGSYGTVIFWDPRDGRRIAASDAHHGTVYAGAFCRGSTLVTVDESGSLFFWDGVTGTQIRELRTGAHADMLAADPEGRWIVVGTRKKSAMVLDAADGRCLHALGPHADNVFAVALHAASGRVASGSSEGDARIWDLETGALLGEFEAGGVILNMALSPDGRDLGVCLVDGAFQLRDATTATIRWRQELPEEMGSAHSVAFRADGKYLVVGTSDGWIAILDRDGRLVERMRCHDHTVRGVAFLPDGLHVASGSHDRTVRVSRLSLPASDAALPRHVVPTRPEPFLTDEHQSLIRSLAFSGDGNLVATGSRSYPVRVNVWGVENGVLLRSLSCENDQIESISFDPQLRWLAALQEIGYLRIWDLSDGTLRHDLRTEEVKSFKVLFSATGERLVTRGRDGVQLWDAERGELLGRFAIASLSLANPSWEFGPHGAVLAVASEGALSLVSSETGAEVLHLDLPDRSLTTFGFSSDGRYLATGWGDGAVIVWDLFDTSKGLRVLPPHAGRVAGVSFSADATRVASASPVDRRLHVFALDDDAPLHDVDFPDPDDNWSLGSDTVAARLRFTSDGRFLSMRLMPGRSSLFDVERGRFREVFRFVPQAGRLDLAPEDGRWLVDDHGQETVIFDRLSRRIVSVLPIKFDLVEFSPTESAVFAGAADRRLGIYRILTPG